MIKILVIEDDENLRTGMLALLEAEQFQAFGAENGRVGLELVRQHLPDVIICDIMMPDLDGYGTLQALKQDPVMAQIPFIFLTALTDRVDMRQGMELGADDFLTKPYRIDELLNAVASVLGKQAIRQKNTTSERDRAKSIQQQLQALQEISATKDDLLEKLLDDLAAPISTITMTIELLESAPTEPRRQVYLKSLREEFNRQVELINQVAELKKLLTPDNIKLLRQLPLLKR